MTTDVPAKDGWLYSASWPATDADVTADGLAKHYAMVAALNFGAADAYRRSEPQWQQSIGRAVAFFAVAQLLREWHRSYPVAAEYQAHELWLLMQMGEQNAIVWKWLRDWDVDATAVIAEGTRAAKAETVSNAGDRLTAIRRELRMQTITADTTTPNGELRRVLGVLTGLAGDGELPEQPAMVQAECETGDHPPVYTRADDEGIGYGFPCPYCLLSAAYERHLGCEHARHRSWRRWRLTHWLVTKAYTLGISSTGCGVKYGGGCKGCLISGPRFRGERVYVLGVLVDHWRCLLKMRHVPGDPIGFGFCSKCVPCPDCGSKTADHEPGCQL